MAYAVLVAWSANVVVGLVVLTMWLRRRARSRFPTRLVITHVSTATLGLALWILHLTTDRSLPAWAAFIVLNVNNGVGDAILTGRWRAGAGTGPSWLRDYGRATLNVLKGRRPPTALFHAFLAGLTFVLTLVACILQT